MDFMIIKSIEGHVFNKNTTHNASIQSIFYDEKRIDIPYSDPNLSSTKKKTAWYYFLKAKS